MISLRRILSLCIPLFALFSLTNGTNLVAWQTITNFSQYSLLRVNHTFVIYIFVSNYVSYYLSTSPSPSLSAQLGVTKEGKVIPAAEEATSENQKWTKLTEQDAVDIAALIKAAAEDPQTIQMIAKLKDENIKEIEELRNHSEEEILNGLKQSIDELKMADYLFQDKERALREMEKENMIPPEHLAKYKANPDLLEEDTTRALYFNFVSLAVVGGYL